jgi:hypothetical protein
LSKHQTHEICFEFRKIILEEKHTILTVFVCMRVCVWRGWKGRRRKQTKFPLNELLNVRLLSNEVCEKHIDKIISSSKEPFSIMRTRFLSSNCKSIFRLNFIVTQEKRV